MVCNFTPSRIAIETSFLDNEVLKIKCFDVTGRMVFEDDNATKKSKAEIDLSFLSSGVYWLQLNIDNKTARFKLIKT